MSERQHQVSRLEGFSDAVFGFSLALLVVSMETPDNVADLLETALGFVPFALTFAMVSWIWYEHNVFFRRYGLQDPWTVFLNAVLLFVVLFYVYPLKYMATMLVALATGRPIESATSLQAQLVMLIYSGGVVLIFGCFVMLYRHAWRQRRALGLSVAEETELKYGQRSHMISMGFGLTSMAIVSIQATWAPIAGLIYTLMGPAHGWNGYQAGRAQDKLRQAAMASDPEPRPEPEAETASDEDASSE